MLDFHPDKIWFWKSAWAILSKNGYIFGFSDELNYQLIIIKVGRYLWWDKIKILVLNDIDISMWADDKGRGWEGIDDWIDINIDITKYSHINFSQVMNTYGG